MADFYIYDLTDEWDDGGTTWTAIKMDVTDTASAAGSLLLDLQVGSVSKAKFDKSGYLTFGAAGSSAAPHVNASAGQTLVLGGGNGINFVTASGSWALRVQSDRLELQGDRFLSFSSDDNAGDLRLYRDAAASLAQRSGTTAQTFRLYGTWTDASNNERLNLTATGTSFDILTSQAGSGTARDLRLGTSGTARWQLGASTGHLLASTDNTYDIGASGATRPRSGYFGTSLTVPIAILSGQSLTGAQSTSLMDLAATWNTTGAPTAIKLNITDTASNAASLLLDLQVGGISRAKVSRVGRGTFIGGVSLGSGDLAGITESGAGLLVFRANANDRAGAAVAGFVARSSGGLNWSTTDAVTNTYDLQLFRGGAGILEQRVGTAAQSSRIYFSYTDASNYTRLALKTATGVHTIETESLGTGEANIDLALTPKGTGRVRFGTFSALAAEVVTGYITVKDAAGNSRKLAVIA